jgi:pyruvate formate lyase activating enzyme
MLGGKEYTVPEIIEKVTRCRPYFGMNGGLTVSGGEPLLQSDFTRALFLAAHETGINTCLDTSGCILDERAKALLSVTDRVLLDVKYTNDNDYKDYVGCSLSPVLSFLAYLDEKEIKTTLRQVIIPTKNDDAENILKLAAIANAHRCVDKVELLPFKKICKVKYDELGIEFPFGDLPTPTADVMRRLNEALAKNVKLR